MTASNSLKYLPQAERLLSGTITTGGGINASVTTFDISNPPTKLPTFLELEPDVAAQREVVRVINVVGNTVTVERGVYNAGVGKTHAQNVAYKQKITSKHWDAIVGEVESGYIIEDPAYTFAKASATTFTITGSDRTTYYTAGRIVRLNGSNIVVVASSAYSTGVTTVTIAAGTIPSSITSIEPAIQPIGASNLLVFTSDLSLQSPTYATDTGAADAYVATYNPVPLAYVEGMRFRFKAANANTGASTININGLGVKTIKKQHDIDLVAGDIEAGQIVEIEYDGTNFQMISVSGLVATLSSDGWTADSHTYVYVSASSFKVTGVDLTSVFRVGTKIKFTQTTDKYFVVTSSSFSTDTTVNIAVNTDYTIANAAITAPYYSYQEAPQGYPDWFTFTVTANGFSVAPTMTGRFRVSGRTVFVNIETTANGVSNASTFTIALPINSGGHALTYQSSGFGADNTLPTSLTAFIGNGDNQITLYKGASATSNWTASGAKGANIMMVYEI